MTTRKNFIYSHRAKLSWKLLKHGVGVVAGVEEREGRITSYPRNGQGETDYLEVPFTR